jgi:hypothetical protein
MVVRPPVRRGERIRLVVRPHGVTLVPGFAAAVLLASGGVAGLVAGWPWTPIAATALAAAALVALQSAWRWERTQVVLTEERLYVVEGTWRRRTTAAALSRVEVSQSVAGRLLGYGTLVAGELEIPFVPDPGQALRLIR